MNFNKIETQWFFSKISIGSPSVSIEEIRSRHCLVEYFYQRPQLRNDIRNLLKGTDDVLRILQKFMLNRGGLVDLVALKRTFESWSEICNRTRRELEGRVTTIHSESLHLKDFLTKFTCLRGTINKIGDAVIENDDTLPSPVDSKLILEDDLVDGSEIQVTDNFRMLGEDRKPRWTIKPQ